MEDSGKRQQFETGAVRDTAEDKPRPALISPFFAERLGRWSGLGAKKYDDRNWEKGMPFSRVLDSLERHIIKYKQGDRSEDHLAAIGWNAQALTHYEEMISRGILPEELDDLPRYEGERSEEPESAPYTEYDEVVYHTGGTPEPPKEKSTSEKIAEFGQRVEEYTGGKPYCTGCGEKSSHEPWCPLSDGLSWRPKSFWTCREPGGVF